MFRIWWGANLYQISSESDHIIVLIRLFICGFWRWLSDNFLNAISLWPMQILSDFGGNVPHHNIDNFWYFFQYLCFCRDQGVINNITKFSQLTADMDKNVIFFLECFPPCIQHREKYLFEYNNLCSKIHWCD